MRANLQIAYAIWGFSECITQSADCVNSDIAWNIYIYLMFTSGIDMIIIKSMCLHELEFVFLSG